MFLPFNNGTVEKIQGLTINIPPVGFVPDYYSGSGDLIASEVLFEDKEKTDQYWRRPFDIKDYNIKRAAELKLQKSNTEYRDELLTQIKITEWKRRLNGTWLMNNGKPVYLTGLYYFYLTHWRLDDGYPQYRINDYEKSLFWQYIVEDSDALGLLEATLRRGGKTYYAGCEQYEFISRTKNARGGIQSKTDTDARDSVYRNAIIAPFKHLPDFFKPIFDEDKGANPKGELSFSKTIRKGDDVLTFFDTELNSVIDFKSAEPLAYDGSKLKRYTSDECGKLVKHDIYERHNVVKFCCMVGTDIIGKCLYTTTVEDREDGGDNFAKLWIASNHLRRLPSGRTESGLYKFFMPADRAMDFNKYGEPNVKENRKKIMEVRKSLEANPKELAAYIRRMPLNEAELFMTDSQKCPFNVMILTETLEYCRNLPGDSPEMEIQGDFVWKEKDKEVMWVPNNINGRCMMSFLPDKGQQNRVVSDGRDENKFRPLNEERHAIGCDPVNSGSEAVHGSSNAAAAVFRKFDINHRPERSDTFIVDYLFDPDNPEEFYEDMIILCFFFGCQIHIENNKFDIFNYFKRRGYRQFVMNRPENTTTDTIKKNIASPGTSASVGIIDLYINRLKTLFAREGGRIRNKRILEDALKFTYDTRTERDLTVACGFTVLAAEKPYEPKAESLPINKLWEYYGR